MRGDVHEGDFDVRDNTDARRRFASAALQGLIVGGKVYLLPRAALDRPPGEDAKYYALAFEAWRYADAMLAMEGVR
jgi:hypothetical protein